MVHVTPQPRRHGVIDPRRVLVVGGGVSALEALIALRDIGSGLLRLELVSPSRSFVLDPQLVDRPQGATPVEIDVDEFCADLGVRLHVGEPAAVEQLTRTLRLADGHTLGYDELLIACGALPFAPYAGIRTLGLGALSDQLAALRPGRLSIVVPPGVAWTFPAYQLALLAAGELAIRVEVITTERRPLELFGERAPGMVTELLAHAGVTVLPRCVVPPGSDLFTLLDNAIALPLVRGPGLVGLPTEGDGFLPVDAPGRVLGATSVHAAGDVTSRPLKEHGLAAQDAGIAATDIAREAGASRAGKPAPRVLRGTLVATDGTTVHLRRVLDGRDAGAASPEPLWPPRAATGAWRLTSWLEHRPEPAASAT
ncbi:MAG: hypothetical protein JWO02_1727 [Solirubrobacterales bacterium]|nr:hypothetical protein [Solirubrobacterales bacterium]